MALDIIGDVHGHAEALVSLLTRLGYREREGAFRHADRKAVFVGDLIDRGSQQLRTVDTVRRMVDAGAARCLMGNHEYNAIGWHTPDPWHPGDFLRRHDHDHRNQHHAFLAEVDGKPQLHDELVDWFRTLPMWLDLDGCRVIHACWNERHMQALAPHLNGDGSLERDALERNIPKSQHAEHQAIEVLLKGPEARLPPGVSFVDKDKRHRREVRLAWWRQAQTFRAAALPMPGLDIERIPEVPLPEGAPPAISDGGPIFFGHYWMHGTPQVLGERFACVDHSAGHGKPLVAYRFDGEPQLDSAKFVASDRSGSRPEPGGCDDCAVDGSSEGD